MFGPIDMLIGGRRDDKLFANDDVQALQEAMTNNKKNTADCNVVTNKRFGLVIWDIPIDFIKALDTLLGLPD